MLPLVNRLIPIVADDYVDLEFGTGCVKITPAHDFNDYEVCKRHHLPLINIFDRNAAVLAKAQVFNIDGTPNDKIRSEESRVGKGWVRTCRSGGSPTPTKK